MTAPARNVLWFKGFPNGRLANAAFQYAFARYAERKLGCEIVLGGATPALHAALPWMLFGLPSYAERIAQINDPQACFEMPALSQDRRHGVAQDIEAIRTHFERHPGSTLIVDGFFQYDTHNIAADPDYRAVVEEMLGLGGREATTPLQQALQAYRRQIDDILGGYLVALHVRRGDYLAFQKPDGAAGSPIFYTTDLDACVAHVSKFVASNRIANPYFYVASDDLPHCNAYFRSKGLNIITRETLLPAGRNEVSELLLDFAALASARAVVASNSSLSVLACLANERARVFFRPMPDGAMVSFDPWATPVLLGA